MDRPLSLIRDYGLSLLLLLASAMLLWKTLVPQMSHNLELDQKYQEIVERNEELLEQNRRLLLLEQAKNDPLLLERVYRMYFGEPSSPPAPAPDPNLDPIGQGGPER